MNSGIYHVNFTSEALQAQGEGLVVVKQNTINGGDTGYTYRGTFEARGTTFTGKLKIKRWNQSAVSIFGNVAEFDLLIEGTIRDDRAAFTGRGIVEQNPSMQLTVDARRIEDAA